MLAQGFRRICLSHPLFSQFLLLDNDNMTMTCLTRGHDNTKEHGLFDLAHTSKSIITVVEESLRKSFNMAC